MAEDILVARLHFQDKTNNLVGILFKAEAGMDRRHVREAASVVGSVTGVCQLLCAATLLQIQSFLLYMQG